MASEALQHSAAATPASRGDATPTRAAAAGCDAWEPDTDWMDLLLDFDSLSSTALTTHKPAAPLLVQPPVVALPTGLTTQRLDTKRPKSSSDRRKREMGALREEVAELGEIVQRLQEGLLNCVWKSGDRNAMSRAVCKPKWKDVARREAERLRRSTDKSAELKEKVASQKHLARCLRRVLTKRMAQIAIISKALKNPRDWSQLGSPPDDSAVFAQLLTNTDAMYTQLDTVERLLASKTARAQDCFRSWEVKHATAGDSSSLVYLEMVGVEEMPFANQAVYCALQSLVGDKSTHMNKSGAESSNLCADAFVRTMHASFSSELRSGTNRFRSVTRCYLQATRCIILTTTYIDSIGDTDGSNSKGLVLREHKWTILSHRELGSEHVTRIETLSTITPEFVHPSLASLWRKDVVETVVIPPWETAVAANQQRLENALLQQSSASSTRERQQV